MATNSLHFMKFDMQQCWTTEDLSEKVFSSVYDEDEKFIANEVTDSIVDGYYITYYNARELMFNEETNSLENVMVKKSLVIPFSIDIVNKIIDVWSNKINANKLVTQLGIRLNHKVRIESISINLEKIASNLESDTIKIGKIKIENYQIENDIIANCTFDLKNHSNPVDIVKKYSKDLVQLALIVSDRKTDLLSMMIYKSGSVVVYKAKDEISLDTLEFIRKICVR